MKGYVSALVLTAALAIGQAPPPGRVIGEVTAVDSTTRQLTVKADTGGTVAILPNEKTIYLRVPPGEKDLQRAVRISLSEIGPGDRVLARGAIAADGQSLNALSIIVMSRAELARKREAERAEWQSRGVAGVITALNPDTREITIAAGARDARRSVVIEAPANARFRRYAPDSVRFADVKPSSFAELKAGDQVRALGEKSADGARVKAEEIVSGSFRNIAGEVKSVDAAANEIRITDLESKKPLTICVNSDSALRRFPPTMAAMLARRSQPGAAPPAEDGGRRRDGVAGPRAGGGDFQHMIERLPALSLGELKPGDAILVAGTNGAEAARITAITVLAGVEPLLAAAPQGGSPPGGAWTFEIPLP